jgi:hypothetical protein
MECDSKEDLTEHIITKKTGDTHNERTKQNT